MKTKKITFSLLLTSVMFVSFLFVTSCDKDAELLDEQTEEVVDGSRLKATGQVTRSGSTWTGKVDGVTRYTGTDMFACVNAVINNMGTAGGTVTIKNSGDSGSSGGKVKSIVMRNNITLDFGGTTINANSGDDLIVPIQADRRSNIAVKNLKINGRVRYGIWFKGCTGMTISNVTMTLSGSGSHELGIRVDNSSAATKTLTINGTINISGGKGHAIETYGLDGFNIGNVTVNNTKVGCGLILNQSKNGKVGTVTGNYNNRGGGYATFRVANNNGPGVTVSKVYSRNSGRGVFSVSGSRGCTITTVDIANNTSHGVFLEDATDTKINGGKVTGCKPNVQHVRTKNCVTKVNGKTYTAANGKW